MWRRAAVRAGKLFHVIGIAKLVIGKHECAFGAHE